MNSRIRSSNVQVGESLVLNTHKRGKEDSQKEIDELMAKAAKQQKAIIQEAQQQAADLIKNCEQDIENLKQQSIENGYAEGLQKGYDEGIARARQEVLEQIWGMDSLANSSFTLKKEIIDSAEKEIIELSIAIAEKVIRQELETSPEQIQGIVKAAIAQLSDKEEVKIIVNPALTESLYEFCDELKGAVKGLKNIRIAEDRTIPRDGVIVESVESRIDARVESQLKEIVKNLMQEYSESTALEGTLEEDDNMIE